MRFGAPEWHDCALEQQPYPIAHDRWGGRFSGAKVALAVFLVVFAAAFADASGVGWLAMPAVILGTIAGWLTIGFFAGGVGRRIRSRRNSR